MTRKFHERHRVSASLWTGEMLSRFSAFRTLLRFSTPKKDPPHFPLSAATFLTSLFIILLTPAISHSASHVSFDANGIAQVDSKPFFPIGVFTYELNSEVLAELHELQANTILNGFATQQLDLIRDHGLMAVCFTDPPWIAAATNHPALLGWYLVDEPEGRGIVAADLRKRYAELKAMDPRHPIGICHTSFEALTQFKDACDFTLTDIYPITKNRDQNIMGVSIMTDEARRIHGTNWPAWTYIQAFGGPETDNGVWAVPLPHEERFMVYQALVHRSTGILYFSYWPRQPRLWQSIAAINRELHQLIPRLVAPGEELYGKSSAPQIQLRVRGCFSGRGPAGGTKLTSGVIIAINTTPKFVQTTIETHLHEPSFRLPFENRSVSPDKEGMWRDQFGPYDVHVYTWGPNPEVSLARYP